MTQKVIEVEAASLKEATTSLIAQIPEGFFLLSQEVLMDGNSKSVEAMSETTSEAYRKAEIGIPTGYEVIKRDVLQQPGKRTFELLADNDQLAIEQAKTACQDRANLSDVRLIMAGKKGFLGIGHIPNRYSVEVMDLAVVKITARSKAKVRGILDDQGPLQLLYEEEQKYYPVAPIEIKVILLDAECSESMSETFDNYARGFFDIEEIAKIVPCGNVLNNCQVTYHTAKSDKIALELILLESVTRNLNAVLIECTALAGRIYFLLAIMTTVPQGKKPHVINAGRRAALVLQVRGAEEKATPENTI